MSQTNRKDNSESVESCVASPELREDTGWASTIFGDCLHKGCDQMEII